MFNKFKNLPKERKAKYKKRGAITAFILSTFTAFGLGYGLKDEIKASLAGKPEVVIGLTSAFVFILLIVIISLIARRLMRPLREKRQLRKLERQKLEHELEKIKEEKANA